MEHNIKNIFESKIFLNFKDKELDNQYNNKYRSFLKIRNMYILLIIIIALLLSFDIILYFLYLSDIIICDILINIFLLMYNLILLILLISKKYNSIRFYDNNMYSINLMFYIVFTNIYLLVSKANNISINYIFLIIFLENIFRCFWFAYFEFYFLHNSINVFISIIYVLLLYWIRSIHMLIIFTLITIRAIYPFALYLMEKRDKFLYFCLDKITKESLYMKSLINNIHKGMITIDNFDPSKIFFNNEVKKIIPDTSLIVDFLFKNINIENEMILGKLQKISDSFIDTRILSEILLILQSCKEFTLLGSKNINNKKFYQIYHRYNENLKNTEFIINDITNVVKKENVNAQLKYKKIFLNKICHEFRNPLTNILSLVEKLFIIFKKDLNDRQEIFSLLNSIFSLAHLMNILIYDFEFLTCNISKKSTPIKKFLTFCSVNEIIEDCLNMYNAKIKMNSKNIILHKNVEIGLSFIRCDQIKLKQILLNLLSNAYKFTNSGKILITAKEIFDNNKNHIIISVTDYGVGISQDKLESINNAIPFTKSLNLNNIYGLGLGLYIVKNLVDLIGKDLKIKSELGKGTCISFKIESSHFDNYKFALSSKHLCNSIIKNQIIDDCYIKMRSSKNVRNYRRSSLDITSETILCEQDNMIIEYNHKKFVKYDNLSNYNSFVENIPENHIYKFFIVEDESLIRESHIRLIDKYFTDNHMLYEVIECEDGVECLYKLYQYIKNGLTIDAILSDESMNFMNGSLLFRNINILVESYLIKPIQFFLITAYQVNNICISMDYIINKPLDNSKMRLILEKVCIK